MDLSSLHVILDMLQFSKGSLTIRYLGVSLSTKQLSMIQCISLIDKMMDRVTHWNSKLSSYAGRVQLVKSILFAIQIFWAQIFILFKKVLKAIEVVCKSFLWIGENSRSKKAVVAW